MIQILKQPNNILGIEYLKALIQSQQFYNTGLRRHELQTTITAQESDTIDLFCDIDPQYISEQNLIEPLFSRVPDSLHDLYKHALPT